MKCPQCSIEFERRASHVNRSLAIGAPIYCSRKCSGLARRLKNPPCDAEKKAAKKVYDASYRLRDPLELKTKKAEYYKRTRDPAKAAIVRKARMHLHVAYCQRPEYKALKAEYDKRKRFEEYGRFAEAAMLLEELHGEIRSRATDYEIRVAKGYYTRNAQQRRRDLWLSMKKN